MSNMGTRSLGLIGVIGDDQLLINLRRNIVYVILKETVGPSRKILAKVIDINGRQTFKPNTDTAAVLLYLLTRDDGDDILLSDYISFILDNLPEKIKGMTKPSDIGASIKTFLSKLETQYKVLKTTVVPSGYQGATDFDPVGLLATLNTWEDPDLIQGGPPTCKTSTFYSPTPTPNPIAVPIRRG